LWRLGVGGVVVPHYYEYPLFEGFDGVVWLGGNWVEEVHGEGVGAEVEGFAGGHDLAAVEDDAGDDGFAGVEGEAEGAVVEGFEGFGGFVAGTFGVDTHVQAHFEGLFHFCKAFAAAGFAAAVDQHAAGAVHQAEDGDLRHFYFGDRFVAFAGYAGRGDGDVDKRVVIADDDVGLVFGEFFLAFYSQRGSGEGEEDAHPNPRERCETDGFFRVGLGVGEQEEGDHEDQHGDGEDQDDPDGPDAGEDVPEGIFEG